MPLRILIVEDDALIAADLDAILEDAGHHVIGVAPDMSAALEIADGCAFDIALMDVELAGRTSGARTAQLLRERFGVPSLFVSGRITDAFRSEVASLQPIGFVAKPYSPANILAALRSFG